MARRRQPDIDVVERDRLVDVARTMAFYMVGLQGPAIVDVESMNGPQLRALAAQRPDCPDCPAARRVRALLDRAGVR